MADLGWLGLARGAVAAYLVGAMPVMATAQQQAAAAPLVFDEVTVVDVEHGKLVPAQRVVIAGNRIQTVGAAQAVKTPPGAQVVDAKGKYLIPGLWDLHSHTMNNDPSHQYVARFIANGVTGIRDAGVIPVNEPARVSVERGIRLRREILAGTRVGLPRMIITGPILQIQTDAAVPWLAPMQSMVDFGLLKESERRYVDSLRNAAGARDRPVREMLDSFLLAKKRIDLVVKALKASGVDALKLRHLSSTMCRAFAAAARRAGIPFGGHAEEIGVIDASDNGASIVDHVLGGSGGIFAPCLSWQEGATVNACWRVAEHFRRNNTWWVPTLAIYGPPPPAGGPVGFFLQRLRRCEYAQDWTPTRCNADSPGLLDIVHRVGLPIMAGTDASESGANLHKELAVYVAEGLTTVEALQTATLNPAKYLRGTDSLGTVAPGKLADLVLLDADPLADITNTTTIRAVVANGRYFDRASLDTLLMHIRSAREQSP